MNAIDQAKDFYERTGKLVHKTRKSLGLGLRELAKITGVSASTISRFENGKEISAIHYVSLSGWLLDTHDEEVKK